MKWDKSFEIGNKIIDHQHKKLVRLINKLIDENKETDSGRLVANALEEMLSYALTHFKTEERMLVEAGYEDFTEHKKEHLEFIKKTSELSINIELSTEEIRTDLINYLQDWLTYHILEEDMEFKDLLKDKDPSDIEN